MASGKGDKLKIVATLLKILMDKKRPFKDYGSDRRK